MFVGSKFLTNERIVIRILPHTRSYIGTYSMGLCVGKYGSDRYFGHNLDLYLILAHWPIYVLAHPFSETEDRYSFALPAPQRIQYVVRSQELGAYLTVMGCTVVLGLVVGCIVAFPFFQS